MKKLNEDTVYTFWNVCLLLMLLAITAYIDIQWFLSVMIALIFCAIVFLLIYAPRLITRAWNTYIANEDQDGKD